MKVEHTRHGQSQDSAGGPEATLGVIQTGGLSRVSISKVASAAGMTRQTVYNYFSDVESIVEASLNEHSAMMERYPLDVIEQTEGCFETFEALAALQIGYVSPEHNNLALESGLSESVRQRLAQHMGRVKEVLAEVLERAKRARHLSVDFNPQIAVELMWGIIDGGMATALKYPDQKPYILAAVAAAMRSVIES